MLQCSAFHPSRTRFIAMNKYFFPSMYDICIYTICHDIIFTAYMQSFLQLSKQVFISRENQTINDFACVKIQSTKDPTPQ